ncbi:MAG: glycosyltransferase family 2 protein [Phycisphaerales bacterium]|nr:glycosyltransferase family 2 protein [Phycisphaerales bacterium]
MIHVERTILVFLAVWGVVCAVYWTTGIVRFIRTRLTSPMATAAERMPDPPDDAWPTVCVVVPAHNEEASIGSLLETLLRQDYPPDRLRVVFSLDRCTDATERVIRGRTGEDARIAVHTVDRCPDGWAGKVHALWHAVMNRNEAFNADLLLFIDADTLLHPSCVRWTVKLRQQRGCGLLSLYSTLAKRYWFEHLVQPATAGELLRQYPLLRSSEGPTTRSMANGQYMLFTRETYFHVGTHACVKDEVLEDTAMAQIVKALGHRCEVFFADGALVCRMYDTWSAFVSGWKRLYIELANRRPQRMLLHARAAVLTGSVMPVLSAAALAAGLLVEWHGGLWWYALAAIVGGLAGLAGYYGCLVLGVVWGGASLVGAALYPVGSAVTAWILLCARADLLSGVPVRWGGKEYTRTPRLFGDGVPIRARSVAYEVPPRRQGAADVAVVVRSLDGVKCTPA